MKKLNNYISRIGLNKIQFIKSLLVIFLVTLITSCGVWTNFKTYFNTYYNANRIFEETEEKLLEEREELFYYEEIIISKNLSSNFDEVIEKTSAILQHNKESDFVDEALIMTGKSFYYQQNYSRALRKFNELATMPQSELFLENKYWIAKTQLQLREFNQALKTLDEVKSTALANEEDEIFVEASKSKIGYLIYNKDYSIAVNEINELLSVDIDDALKAEVLYELGLLYKLSEDYASAEKTFAQVEEYSPTFEVDFNSKFQVAILKGELGNIDTSLTLLQLLRDEDKFSDNWGEIDLEIGKIYYDKNEIDLAIDKFTEVDTTYNKTEAAGISGFYRAEILENFYHDYDSALVLYKIAAYSNAPQEFRSLAQKKTSQLDKYLSFHSELKNLKTQLIYLTDNNIFIQDSLEYVEKVRLDSIKAADEILENEQSRGGSRKNIKPTYKKPERPKITIDSVHALNSKYYFELANLLFSEFDDPDSAYYYYSLSLEENEENPNQAQTYFAMGNYFLIKEDKPRADSMFTLVYDKFQFDPIRNEAAKQIGKPLYDFDKDPVEEEFNEAEIIYESSKYNQAIKKLFGIYKDNPSSIYAPKSLYTIGYILENDLNQPDSAASVYDTLSAKYRTSEYAKAVLIKLSGYRESKKSVDSTVVDKSENLSKQEQAIEESASISELNDDNIVEDDTEIEETLKEEINNTEIENLIPTDQKIIPPDSTIVDQNEVTSKLITSEESREIIVQSDDLPIVGRDIYGNPKNYFVQVSSWKTKSIAEEEVEKLINKKYNALMKEVFVESLNSIYYRVRVGPYKSFAAAKKVRLKLNGY